MVVPSKQIQSREWEYLQSDQIVISCIFTFPYSPGQGIQVQSIHHFSLPLSRGQVFTIQLKQQLLTDKNSCKSPGDNLIPVGNNDMQLRSWSFNPCRVGRRGTPIFEGTCSRLTLIFYFFLIPLDPYVMAQLDPTDPSLCQKNQFVSILHSSKDNST